MPKKKGVTIPKIKQLPSGAYNCYMRLKDADGTVRNISITEPDYATVEAKAKAIKSGIMEAGKQPRHLTLTQAVDNYISERSNTLSPSTIRGYRIIQRTRFKNYMERDVSSFTERRCRSMVNDEATFCSPKTLKNAWRFISSVIFNETGERFSVPLPQETREPHKFLDYTQIAVFVQAIRGSSIEIPALFALCSLRLSEILAVDWSKIDLAAGTVRVSGAVVRDSANQLVSKKSNKNSSSTRVVKIFIPRLLELLEQADKDEPVISVTSSAFYRIVQRICRENGLPEVGIHGLRHSFASLSYHLGIPEEIAMEIGGWKNDKIMSEIYTHLAAGDVNLHRDKLTDFFTNISAPS